MSDIQRWAPFDPMALMGRHPNGAFVTYADHVAAVAAAEQRVRDEFMDSTPELTAYRKQQYAAGVKAAREAVERCRNGFILAIGASLEPPERYWIPKSDALAAIDGVKGEQ